MITLSPLNKRRLSNFKKKPPGGLVAVDLLHFVWLEPVRGIFGQ